MLRHQEILKSLPPPRDDEPSSLRQDIVDEILDHLKCGLRRELLIRGGDEAIAKQRVLQNFGDPNQIARKLWFQAMWSKIMTQRLVVGSAIFSMIVSLILVVLVGWMVQQQQIANASLMKEFANFAPRQTAAVAQRDLRWNSLKVKVTTQSKDGPAAEGFKLIVERKAGIGELQDGARFDATIDSSGVTDCGYVEPGRYEAIIKTPWGEQAISIFTMHPGNDHLEAIVAPEKMPEPCKTTIHIDGLPEHLELMGAGLAIWCKPIGSREFAGRPWTFQTSKTTPVMMLVPSQGSAEIWFSNILTESHQDELLSVMDEIRSADWRKIESSFELNLPANRYSILFEFIPVNTYKVGEDSKWVVPQPSFMNLPVSKFRGPSEMVAEAGKLNDWTIPIPDNVAMILSTKQQVGGGFF